MARTAELLDVSEPVVYDLLKMGELKSFMLGRKRLITGASIAELIRSRLQPEYAPEGSSPNLRESPTRKRQRPAARRKSMRAPP